MGENRYPPGYIPLTIHELSSGGSRGQRNGRSMMDYLGEGGTDDRRGGPRNGGGGSNRSRKPNRGGRRGGGGGGGDRRHGGRPQGLPVEEVGDEGSDDDFPESEE